MEIHLTRFYLNRLFCANKRETRGDNKQAVFHFLYKITHITLQETKNLLKLHVSTHLGTTISKHHTSVCLCLSVDMRRCS